MNNIIAQSEINIEKAKAIFDNLDVMDSTRNEYKNRIFLFINFINMRGLNSNSFLEFKRYLNNLNNYSVSTKNKFLIVGKIFLRELYRMKLIPLDITTNVKTFSQDKKHKRFGLSEEQVIKLMERYKKIESTPQNLRIKALLSMLIFQGLRGVEITRLNVGDLSLINSIAYVQSKGKHDKELIHLHSKTTKILSEYLKANKISDGPLFVSISNNSKNLRLTTRGLRSIVYKIFKESGISGKSPHSARKYFCTCLIKNFKSDILEVSRFTRHKNLEMLLVYDDAIKMRRDIPKYEKSFEKISF
jgi:integrase/recombinase XerC